MSPEIKFMQLTNNAGKTRLVYSHNAYKVYQFTITFADSMRNKRTSAA